MNMHAGCLSEPGQFPSGSTTGKCATPPETKSLQLFREGMGSHELLSHPRSKADNPFWCRTCSGHHMVVTAMSRRLSHTFLLILRFILFSPPIQPCSPSLGEGDRDVPCRTGHSIVIYSHDFEQLRVSVLTTAKKELLWLRLRSPLTEVCLTTFIQQNVSSRFTSGTQDFLSCGILNRCMV